MTDPLCSLVLATVTSYFTAGLFPEICQVSRVSVMPFLKFIFAIEGRGMVPGVRGHFLYRLGVMIYR